jgi:outer membrane lipoprotein-sorting protein
MKKLMLAILAGSMLSAPVQAQSAIDIMERCLDAMGSVKTMSYHFVSQERFKGGVMKQADVKFKIQVTPLKIYADVTKPQSAKLSYIPSVSAKVSVKKGPLKLNFEPTNSMLIGDQHHPVNKAGFGSVKSILEKNLEMRKGEDLSKYVKLIGSVTYQERSCWKIEINDPDHRIIEYTVKPEDKTIWTIGKRMALPEYRISELNGYIDFDDITPGQKIKIPSSYAKKTTLYVDKATYLPIYQKMEDAVGVYEVYEFKDLKIGVSLTDADFQHQ